MKLIKLAVTTAAFCLLGLSVAHAEGDHNLQTTCKEECPAAKTEHEAHECMNEVVKKKKSDKKFRKSDCHAAYKAHVEHEKEEGHKH